VYLLKVFPSLQTLEVLLHIKFTDMLKEGDVTLDPAKTHMSKKDKKKLTKKQYRVRAPCPYDALAPPSSHTDDLSCRSSR
jgi:hypothetical protein